MGKHVKKVEKSAKVKKIKAHIHKNAERYLGAAAVVAFVAYVWAIGDAVTDPYSQYTDVIDPITGEVVGEVRFNLHQYTDVIDPFTGEVRFNLHQYYPNGYEYDR